MATYSELRSLFGYSELRNKIDVACIVAANAIQEEDPGTANHTERMEWARQAFMNPRATSERMMMAVLAANKSQTVANIQGATDAAIQTQVDAAVNLFALGLA